MSLHGQQVALIGADVVSAVAVIGAFAGLLPPLAALGAIIWYAIQIWESEVVQRAIKGHRHVLRRKRLRKRAHHAHPPHV